MIASPDIPSKKPMIVELLYQAETILLSLYSQSQSIDHRPEGKRLWQKCTDICLTDLEQLHEIFALRNQEIRYGMHLQEDSNLYWFTNKFYQRVLKISQLFSSWSHLKKTANIIYCMESKSLRLIKKIAEDDPVDKEHYLKLMQLIEERLRLLRRIIDLYKDEEKMCQFFDPIIFEWHYT